MKKAAIPSLKDWVLVDGTPHIRLSTDVEICLETVPSTKAGVSGCVVGITYNQVHGYLIKENGRFVFGTGAVPALFGSPELAHIAIGSWVRRGMFGKPAVT